MEATAATHVVVVDDHHDIRDPLAEYLTRHGYQATAVADGRQLDDVLANARVDLIILDILMPGESGLDICRRLRATDPTPIILLTAVSEDTEKIIGLEMGADDYITKPFNPRELLARVRSVLRRNVPAPVAPESGGFIGFAGWSLDVNQQTLTDPGGNDVPISTVEFRLLSTFLARPRTVLSRETLLALVSNRALNVFDRAVDNQISRLRKKIEADPKNPVLIKTIRGGGYLFTADVTRAAS